MLYELSADIEAYTTARGSGPNIDLDPFYAAMEAWENLTCEITWNLNGGEMEDDEELPGECAYGDVIAVSDPVRNDYKFNGWYTDLGGNIIKMDELDLFGDPISVWGNIMLTSLWGTIGPPPIGFVVTFNPDNGLDPWNIPVVDGDTVEQPINDPEKAGFIFLGWFTDENEEFDFDTPINGDITLTARWAATGVARFTVIFDVDGVTASVEVEDGDTVDRPDDPEKEGFEFLGWFTDYDVEFDFDTPITGDITLTAKWEVFAGVDFFTVAFDVDGVIRNVEVADGITVKQPDDPKKAGFDFIGWFTDEGEEFDFNTPITGDITLTARWVAIYIPVFFTVIFDVDGAITVVEVAEGNTVARPANPAKANYSFVGWYTDGDALFDFSAAIAGNIRLTARWIANAPRPILPSAPADRIEPQFPADIIIPDGGVNGGDTAETGSDGDSDSDTTDTPDIGGDIIDVVDTGAPGSAALPFTDVNEGDWFYDDVYFCWLNELVKGTADGAFDPDGAVTRAMAVTILYRYEGEPDASELDNPFSDVPEDMWFTDAIKWAADNGIVLGNTEGGFDPDDNISRQDVAAILYRYADFAGIELPQERNYADFDDQGDIAEYAAGPVEALYGAIIVNGKPDNLFDPSGTATRAEFVAMMHRLIKIA
jgi:uncharacterized repeat protein (TIGR02543 family)